MRSSGKTNWRVAPPSGEEPASGTLSVLVSVYAWALLPHVVVSSAPGAPLVSCQPWGEATASSMPEASVRASAGGRGVVYIGAMTGYA